MDFFIEYLFIYNELELKYAASSKFDDNIMNLKGRSFSDDFSNWIYFSC